jgi:hypothetical protein
MNDRELLEAAARAAGITGTYVTTFAGDVAPIGDGEGPWNPLTDDGDALRLACDLGLQVYPVARTLSGAACSAVASVTGMRLSEIADQMHETRSATRRAIVIAAAAMAKDDAGARAGSLRDA